MLTRSLLARSPAAQSASSLLSFILSSLHSTSVRLQLAALSSLHTLLSSTPSLFATPAVLQSFTITLLSPFCSVVDHAIDLLLLQPSLAVANFTLFRTAVSIGLKQDNKAVRAKSYRLLASVLQVLLAQDPVPYDPVMHLVQCCLKHNVTEIDPILRHHGQHCLQLLWSSNASLLPLQQTLVILLQDNRYSLVPQDRSLYEELRAAVAQPPTLATLSSMTRSLFSLYTQTKDEGRLRVLHFLLEASPHIEGESEMISVLLSQSTPSMAVMKVMLLLLKRNHCDDRAQLHSYQKTVLQWLETVDSVEEIELCVQCLIQTAIQLDEIEAVSAILEKCIGLVSTPKGENALLLRAITQIGGIYEGLTRSLYVKLLQSPKDSVFQFERVAQLLVPLFGKTQPLSIQYYALKAYLQCMEHNPGAIAAPELIQIIERLKGRDTQPDRLEADKQPDTPKGSDDRLKGTNTQQQIITIRCVYDYISKVPSVLESPTNSFPQITTPTIVGPSPPAHV